MTKTIVVVGFGPGISTAVAERFCAAGFSVALVARSAERLAAGVAALKAAGVAAAGFTGDAANPTSIRAAIGKARAAFGPVTVLHWNAYGAAEAGDLLTADPAAISGAFDVAVVGLLSAVQEALAGALVGGARFLKSLTSPVDFLSTPWSGFARKSLGLPPRPPNSKPFGPAKAIPCCRMLLRTRCSCRRGIGMKNWRNG